MKELSIKEKLDYLVGKQITHFRFSFTDDGFKVESAACQPFIKGEDLLLRGPTIKFLLAFKSLERENFTYGSSPEFIDNFTFLSYNFQQTLPNTSITGYCVDGELDLYYERFKAKTKALLKEHTDELARHIAKVTLLTA